MADPGTTGTQEAGRHWLSPRQPRARAFLLVWLGQTASAFGSGLTTFALSVWVYQQSQSLVQFGLVMFVNALVTALAAPWLGVLCDRRDPRRLMLLADCGAAVLTVAMLMLVTLAQLRMWHVGIVVAIDAVLITLHQIAYRSLVPGLVPRDRLANANGLIETGLAMSTMLAPMAAGFMLAVVGLKGIFLLDLATFLVAVTTLLLARVGREADLIPVAMRQRASWSREMTEGWRYLSDQAGLKDLLGVVLIAGFVLACVQVLFTPMVLARHDAATLGILLAAGSLGMAAGGVHMLFWRGRVSTRIVFSSQTLLGVCLLALALSRSPLLLGLFLFCAYAVSQWGSIATRVIWQSEVSAQMRGRVFALLSSGSAALLPFAYLGAPMLVEWVFQPWLRRGAAGLVPVLVGVGPGSGAALLIAVLGGLLLISSQLLRRGSGWRELDRRLALDTGQG